MHDKKAEGLSQTEGLQIIALNKKKGREMLFVNMLPTCFTDGININE